MLEKWKIWYIDIIKASKSKGKEVKTDTGEAYRAGSKDILLRHRS